MTAIDLENDRLLRMSEVMQKTGLSESTIYRRMGEDTFPKSIQLSPGCVRWLLSEVQGWVADRIRARDGAPLDQIARAVQAAGPRG